MFKVISLTVIAGLLSACATQPDAVSASYVSPSVYKGQSCARLVSERNQIVRNLNTLSAEQSKQATNDAVATGVALVLFWPAAFLIGASGDSATALASAKGNYDAITAQMISQGCAVPTVVEG